MQRYTVRARAVCAAAVLSAGVSFALAPVRGTVALSDRFSGEYYEVERDGTVTHALDYSTLKAHECGVKGDVLLRIRDASGAWRWRGGYLPVLEIGDGAELFACGDSLYVREGDKTLVFPEGAEESAEEFSTAREKICGYWERWFAKGLQLPPSDARFDAAVKSCLVQALCAFSGRHPSYGAGCYRTFIHDAFPPNVLSVSEALLQFGHGDEAVDAFAYYFRRFVRQDGRIDYYGPSGSEYGALMWLAAMLAEEMPERAGEVIGAVRPLVLHVLSLFDPLSPEPGRPGANRLIAGVPEADMRDAPAEYFHNNFQILRGLVQLSPVLAANGEGELAAETRTRARILRKIIDRAYAKKKAEIGGVPFSMEQKGLPDDIQSDLSAVYANYRYYPEMLECAWLSPEDARSLVEYREGHDGEFHGLTNFTLSHGKPGERRETDNWPMASYARGLLEYGMFDRFERLMKSHFENYLSDDVFTAYEQVFNEGDPRKAAAPACVPVQLLLPRMAAWRWRYRKWSGAELMFNGSASCEVSRDGARVLSFKVRGEELLWQPREWDLKAARDWSHGGIPLCWPWFGRVPGKTMHGFAYRMPFELRRRSCGGTRNEIVLGLKSSAESRMVWPHDFDLEYTVVLDGEALELTIKSTNAGSGDMAVTDGFHPYFAVTDRLKSRVTGVTGCAYRDARVSRDFNAVATGDFRISGHVDHVFDVKGFVYGFVDEVRQREIRLESSGNKRLVVWSPGDGQVAAGSPRPGQIPKEEQMRVVTVEPATLKANVAWHLAPGESHSTFMRITSVPAAK